MVPSIVPPELQDLTQTEEMLIARALPLMRVYVKPGGQRGYAGHCINLPQNVKKLATTLPRYPKELSVIVVKMKGKDDTFKDLTVRREKVLHTLQWLIQHNPLYKDIHINVEALHMLPENDLLPDILNIETQETPDNEDFKSTEQQIPTEDTVFDESSEFSAASKHSFNPQTTLLVENVTVTGAIASICIKVSKTDPFRQGQTIRLAASGSSICPVRSLQKHLNNCPNGKQPLFTFQDATFLTRQTLSALVKQLLRTSELPGLSSHSFRIGAATTAAAAKVPDWLIKTLGRWSSNCYEQYIRTPDNIIESIRSVLVNTVVRRSESWQP